MANALPAARPAGRNLRELDATPSVEILCVHKSNNDFTNVRKTWRDIFRLTYSLHLRLCRTGYRARSRQKAVDFVVVSLEWIAHDKEIPAVARDGIPVDHVREIAVLEKAHGPCTA